MKKIYLSAGILALAAVSFGQHSVSQGIFAPRVFDGTPKQEAIKQQQANGIEKSGGVEVWADDFSTPGVWVADNDGQTAANYGWNINSTSEAWYSTFTGGMNSTSGGDYAEVQNGDYFNDDQALGVTYHLTTAAPIDVQGLGGTNHVSLQFEQYGGLFNDAQTVEVSTDSTVWTQVGSNAGRDVYVGNNAAAVYGNPEVVSFNIANAIASNPDSVWVRFTWTSRNPGALDPVNDLGWWTTWGWYIDDVKIVTNPDNDLTMDDVHFAQGSFAFPYYLVSQSQVGDISFSANVTNNGAIDQMNSVLTVDADGTVLTSAAATIAATTSDSLFTTSTYNPGSTLGTRDFDYSVASSVTDDNPGDNAMSTSIEVTEHIFGRDMAGPNGTNTTGSVNNWADASGDAFKIGNIFEMQADETLYALDIKLAGSAPSGGALLYGEVYIFNSGTQTYDFVEATEEVNISSAGQISSIQTLVLESPVSLFAGDDILIVAGHYGGNTDGSEDLSIAYSGTAVDNSVLGFDASGTLIGLADPVNICVRMNFDLAVGVEEVTSDFVLRQNMPNPFSGNTDIIFDLSNNTEVNLTITDMTGKIVETRDLGNLPIGNHRITIDGSNYASGIYYYTIAAGTSTATKKMIVK